MCFILGQRSFCIVQTEFHRIQEATPTESDRRIMSDLVELGRILIFDKFGQFGRTLSDLVGLCRIWSDSIGFGRIWSDLVVFCRIQSDLVGFSRIRSRLILHPPPCTNWSKGLKHCFYSSYSAWDPQEVVKPCASPTDCWLRCRVNTYQTSSRSPHGPLPTRHRIWLTASWTNGERGCSDPPWGNISFCSLMISTCLRWVSHIDLIWLFTGLKVTGVRQTCHTLCCEKCLLFKIYLALLMISACLHWMSRFVLNPYETRSCSQSVRLAVCLSVL